MNIKEKAMSLKTQVCTARLKTNEDIIFYVSGTQPMNTNTILVEEPHQIVITGQGIVFIRWMPASDLKDNPMLSRRNVEISIDEIAYLHRADVNAGKAFDEQLSPVVSQSKRLVTPGNLQLTPRGAE